MNARRWLTGAVLGFALTMPLVARAQSINLATLDDDAVNRVHVSTGAEYGFVAGVGYARSVGILDRRVLLSGDLTLPWAGLDASDYRLRAGALVPIAGSHRWRLAGTIAPTLRETKNTIARMTSLGADLGVTGGFYARHWFLAGEAGFDWAMTTHVAHSDLYRQAVYADARDGWYARAGGNIRYGLQTGTSFGRHDLVLRLGQTRDVAGASTLLPLYGTLTFETRW